MRDFEGVRHFEGVSDFKGARDFKGVRVFKGVRDFQGVSPVLHRLSGESMQKGVRVLKVYVVRDVFWARLPI